MYKKFSILFIFASILITTIAGVPAYAYKVKTFQPLRMHPLAVPYNPYQMPGLNENYPKVTQIEYALFNRSYEKQNIYNRLSRIERKLFKKTFTRLPLASRLDNITNNMDMGIMYNISSRELSKLEKKVLGRTYEDEDTESRITRMEKEMLGAMQGGNLNKRFETIKTASKHYNSYPEIVQSQTIYPQQYASSSTMPYYPPNGYWNNTTRRSSGFGGMLQNLLGTVFNNGYGTGTITGYTPPIYDPYNRFINPGLGIRNEYRGNTRSFIDNRNYGHGATVRILD